MAGGQNAAHLIITSFRALRCASGSEPGDMALLQELAGEFGGAEQARQ